MNVLRNLWRRPLLWSVAIVGFFGLNQASAQSQDLNWRAINRLVELQRVMDQRMTGLENATIYGRNPTNGFNRSATFPAGMPQSPMMGYPMDARPLEFVPPSVMPAGNPWAPNYDLQLHIQFHPSGYEWLLLAVPR